MVFTLLFFHVAQAAPKPETYFLGTEASLTINKSDDRQISFDLEGWNSFSGNTSSMAGVAVRSGSIWEYQDKEDKTCVLKLKPIESNSVEVTLKECHGSWLSEGVYKIRNKDCGSGFDMRNKEVGSLSRAKKYQEAFKKAELLAKDCLEALDENSQGELHSDLAFLSFKIGDKARCRAEAEKGIQAIGASRLEELKESFEFYAEEDENGKKSCKQGTKPGCWTYEERIKVFKRLDHNRKLCVK